MPPANPSPSGRPAGLAVEFFRRLGLILAASLGVVVVAALALGQFHPFGLSNLLFWAALVVLGIAVVPALAELGSGFSQLGRSLTGRDKGLLSKLVDQRDQRDRWLSNSVLFGTAGIMIFVLSFVFATLFSGR
jgi:hypothetical protein